MGLKRALGKELINNFKLNENRVEEEYTEGMRGQGGSVRMLC